MPLFVNGTTAGIAIGEDDPAGAEKVLRTRYRKREGVLRL
jgi:hypothetical protein